MADQPKTQGAAPWPPPVFRPRLRGRDSRGAISSEGDCPAGAEPVAKVIGALPGDEVEIEPGFVAVNGVKFPNSQTARATARAGRWRTCYRAHGGSARARSGCSVSTIGGAGMRATSERCRRRICAACCGPW